MAQVYSPTAAENNKHTISLSKWESIVGIITMPSGASGNKLFRIGTISKIGTYTIKFRNAHLIDLTQMFGAGNEPTTVEQFYEMMPIVANHAAYNEGEIVDANYGAIKTTGFNQWDEQWRKGLYNDSGEFTANEYGLMCNTNPIPICCGLNYVCSINHTYRIYCFWYDSEMNFLGMTDVYKNIITPIANSAFLNFRMQYEYGNTYKGDICINIAWEEYSALNGTYKPYKPFERDLSWANKYFPNGMRSAGNVADEIRFNSTTQQWEAVQRIGVVDLGSIHWYDWERVGVGWFYSPTLYDFGSKNVLSSKYITTDKSLGDMPDKTINVLGDKGSIQLTIHDSAYTDNATFKAAMDGVMLNYELAEPIVTPITEDVNLAYDVADYGTEQLIVAEGAQSAPLSAEVVYEPNVLASIKQVAAMLTRLDALETAVATMQASAVATTNEE
jgi:hypothetical protein